MIGLQEDNFGRYTYITRFSVSESLKWLVIHGVSI